MIKRLVTISFTKDEIFTLTIALEGYGIDLSKDRILMVKIVKILTKFRKALKRRDDKFAISISMESLREFLPKKPIKKAGATKK